VTQRASYQSRQAIRQVIREYAAGFTVAVGCYGQVFQEELSGIEGLDLILGNIEKKNFLQILEQGLKASHTCVVSEAFTKEMPFDHLPMKGFMDRTRAFLKIQDGCESYCSYCIVPLARGPLRSLEPPHVLHQLLSLEEEGYKEVVITGIHLGKYGVDLGKGIDLGGLLRQIGRAKLGLRIRLSSLEPTEIDRELIEMMASEEWLCRHFHIPLQSGDSTILRRMNRHYTPGEFADLIERIHQAVPMVAIGVDVMAGFPGEDPKAHENTLSLIRDLPISYLHVFPFSPRKGTAAAGFPNQVDSKIIKERARALRDLGREKCQAFYGSCLGESFQVLTEGGYSDEKIMIKGWSDNYLPFVFLSPGLQKNNIVRVRAESLGKGNVIGKPIDI
jgi:threonylcarbamoyladenosine tRNA methylthiotransferase MtaB